MAPYFFSFLYSQLFVSLPYPTTSVAGQTIIVTGANSGLGFEAAKHLVRLGASKVVLAVRSLEKGDTAKSLIELATERFNVVEIRQLDLSSIESVKQFAAQVMKMDRLDAFLHNAGMLTSIFKLLEGNESTITVNALNTELLALLVLPKLQATARKFNIAPRMSFVTSDLHFIVSFPERKSEDIFAALNVEDKANMGERYAVSKLLGIFFVRELGEKIKRSKSPNVIVNCTSPGFAKSPLDRESTGVKRFMISMFSNILGRSTEVGSRALITGLAAGPESQGQYMADCVIASPSNLVVGEEGPELQKRLWDETMKKLEVIQPGISQNLG